MLGHSKMSVGVVKSKPFSYDSKSTRNELIVRLSLLKPLGQLYCVSPAPCRIQMTSQKKSRERDYRSGVGTSDSLKAPRHKGARVQSEDAKQSLAA